MNFYSIRSYLIMNFCYELYSVLNGQQQDLFY